MIDAIRREISRALNGLRFAFRVEARSINRGSPVQLVSVDGLQDEPLPNLELFQQFGFVSAGPAGTQYIAVPLGGRTSACVLVAGEHGAFRFTVNEDGEAAIYNQWGDFIHLRADRTIHAKSAVKVLLETPLVETTSDMVVGGSLQVAQSVQAGTSITAGTDITAAGDVTDGAATGTPHAMSGMRATYDGHDHNLPGGGISSVPRELM
jgi:phage baseplate assembly protein V